MRKKGSPGHTATAGYMAEQSQRNSPKVPFDIDFGDEPQPALAPRGFSSNQLQVSNCIFEIFAGITNRNLSTNALMQGPRPYRQGYSESEATSDDSCYRPRPPTSFRLSPSPHPPEVFLYFAILKINPVLFKCPKCTRNWPSLRAHTIDIKIQLDL